MSVFFSASVSVTTLTVAGPVRVVSAFRVRVRPSTMLVSVLLVEVTGRPLTVAAASAAVWLCVIAAAPAEGSKASIDRPAASALPPSSSVTVVRKAFSAPVALERISRREPLESVITRAVTPAPAALILSRMSARVSVAATVTSIARGAGLRR